LCKYDLEGRVYGVEMAEVMENARDRRGMRRLKFAEPLTAEEALVVRDSSSMTGWACALDREDIRRR
jgi:hypothetical protein